MLVHADGVETHLVGEDQLVEIFPVELLAELSFVDDDFGRVSVTTLALTGPEFSPKEIRAVARELRRRLETTLQRGGYL